MGTELHFLSFQSHETTEPCAQFLSLLATALKKAKALRGEQSRSLAGLGGRYWAVASAYLLISMAVFQFFLN